MFEVDTTEIKQLAANFERFAAKSIPYAARNTMNRSAFEGRKEWQGQIQNKMVTRNKFTVGSVRVERAQGLRLNQMAAVLGSVAPYMETAEFGGTKARKGSKGVPLATAYSAGQSEGSQPRQRLPRKPNRLASIALQKRSKKGKNRKQANYLAVQRAAKGGNKFVYLDLGRRRGIFRVVGGKRNPRVKMIYDLSRASVRIPATPTLSPAVKIIQSKMPEFYLESLRFQAKRHKLFGYR